MPIYEYECKDCQHHFECIQKINDKPTSTCPHCKSAQVERLISAAAFQLKGTGWYVTDFKDKKPAVKEETKTSTETKPRMQND